MTRKVVLGVKDENGQYLPVQPFSQSEPKLEVPSDMAKEPPSADVDITRLFDYHMLIMFRETKALLLESLKGKLSKDSAHSMRENIKLMIEIRKKEKELLDNLSDEEIEKLIEEKNKK